MRKIYNLYLQILIFLNFQVIDALLRESKKEKITYKLEALKCLGEVLEKFMIDKFSDVFTILSPVLIKVYTYS